MILLVTSVLAPAAAAAPVQNQEDAVDDLEIELDSARIETGGTTQVTVTATFEDGSEAVVTDDASLSTDDDSVATVDDSGVVEGQGDGEATVTATYGGQEATTTVTVTTDSPEEFPAAYHGELDIDGEPAPVGVTVEAVVDGEVRGSTVVEEEGVYADDGADTDFLLVDGDEDDTGEPVEFSVSVDGVSIPADQTVEWESGDVKRVDLTVATPNLTVWERAPLPLRADTSVAPTVVENQDVLIERADGGLHTANYDELAVYNASDPVPLELSNEFDAAPTGQFDGQHAELVVGQFDPDGDVDDIDRSMIDVPESIADARGMFQGDELDRLNENVSFQSITTETLEDGTLEGDFDPEGEAGQYVAFVAVSEDAQNELVTDDNLTPEDDWTVIGVDAFLAHASPSEVSVSDAEPGEDVTFDLETDLEGDVHHTVALYNQETFTGNVLTLNLTARLDDDFSEDDLRIESGIEHVNGVANFDGDVSAFGYSVSDRYESGTFSVVDLLAMAEDESGEDAPDFDGNGTVLDASVAGVADANESDTLTVETFDNWTEGDYQWVHVASTNATDESATSAGTITIKEQEVTGLELDVDDDALEQVGDSTDATVTAIRDGAGDIDVTDDADYDVTGDAVSIDENGTVTAEAVGTATITAEYEGYTASVDVTVDEGLLTGIDLAVDDRALVQVGDSTDATVTALVQGDADFDVTDDADFEVTEGAENVSVDDDGTVTAEQVGEATITAEYTDDESGQTFTDSVDLEVHADDDAQVTDLDFELDEDLLERHEMTNTTVTATFDDGTVTDVIADEYASADTDVATVSNDTGVVTAEGEGVTTIEAEYRDATAEATVTVVESGPQPFPAAYHGELEIDGEPAPNGTTVEAVIDGEVRGTATVDDEGVYAHGGPDDDRLLVQGTDADEGATVTFYVDNEDVPRIQAAPDQPVTWTSGDVRRVDLSADLQAFDVEITDTNAPVEEGDSLTVTAEITNTGDETETQTIELSDFDGTVVDDVEVTLDGGESATENLTWETEDGDAGTGNVTVSSENDQDTREVTVEEQQRGGGGGGGGPDPRPTPSFTVSDTSISTEKVTAGESFEITATIENVGTGAGAHDVQLTRDGEVVAEQSIVLRGGESEIVTFTESIKEPGEYEYAVDGVHVATVTVGGGDVFETTDASLSDTEISAGESVEVTATVENVGDKDGTHTAQLLVDGEVVDEQDVTIAAGGSETITFSHAFDDAGEYEIAVDDADAGTLTVSGDDGILPSIGQILVLLFGLVVVVGAGGALYLYWHRVA